MQQQELKDDWHGVKACFCAWGGRSPSGEEVADAAGENGPTANAKVEGDGERSSSVSPRTPG